MTWPSASTSATSAFDAPPSTASTVLSGNIPNNSRIFSRTMPRSGRHLQVSPRSRARGSDFVGIKIAVVGGGSTYTPELIEGFHNRRDRLPVDELVLHDIDDQRLEAVGGLALPILQRHEWPGPLVAPKDPE